MISAASTPCCCSLVKSFDSHVAKMLQILIRSRLFALSVSRRCTRDSEKIIGVDSSTLPFCHAVGRSSALFMARSSYETPVQIVGELGRSVIFQSVLEEERNCFKIKYLQDDENLR